jgi:hypothetical protein
MAQRTWYESPKTLDRKVYQVSGTFFPAGTSDPTFTATACRGVATIARSAQGTWLVTLQDTYKRLLSKGGSIQMTTATDLVFQFGDISNVGTVTPVTVVIRANAVATATDIAANANNSVSFTLLFSDADT